MNTDYTPEALERARVVKLKALTVRDALTEAAKHNTFLATYYQTIAQFETDENLARLGRLLK